MDYDGLYSNLFADMFDGSGQANLHSDQQAPMTPIPGDNGTASDSLFENGLEGQSGDLQNSILDNLEKPFHDHEDGLVLAGGLQVDSRKIFPSAFF